MNLKGAILIICFVLQALNLIAIPVNPNHLAQSEPHSRSNRLTAVKDSEERKPMVSSLKLARKQIRKLTASINSFALSNEKLKTRANKVDSVRRTTARTFPNVGNKESLEPDKVPGTNPQPVAVEATDRLLIPISNFPSSAVEPATSRTPLPAVPLVSSSTPAGMLINLNVYPSPGSDPEEFSELGPHGYSNVSLEIEGEYGSYPSPPAQASQLYESIDLSLSSTAEPTVEESEPQPFSYLPLAYDEFKDSGYNPWTAIYIYVRRLFLEH